MVMLKSKIKGGKFTRGVVLRTVNIITRFMPMPSFLVVTASVF